MHTISIISFSDLSKDPRVDRQIRKICSYGGISMITAGLSKPAVQVYKHVDIRPLRRSTCRKLVSVAYLLTRRYADYYASTYSSIGIFSELRGIPIDLIIANDFNTLPLAYDLAKSKGSKLLLDAHEYAPRQYDDRWKWRILHQPYNNYLGHRYLPELDGMITVSEGIAREYQRVFGIRPEVITNAPDFARLNPSELRENGIRLIYHGAAFPARRIERIIEAMRLVKPGITIDMLLVPIRGCETYFQKLKQLARGVTNVQLLPPVALSDLVASCNKYDVGICFLPASNFNQEHALPNKFFEYIQSRLALVIGPSPEMMKYVARYNLGVVAADFSSRSLARAIDGLTKDSIWNYKNNAHAASKILSAESNMESLMRTVEKLLAGS